MTVTCKIDFDNPERVYLAGQILKGVVTADVTTEVKVRSKYIAKFKNFAIVNFAYRQILKFYYTSII
jgi:hypothetical protein